MPDRYPEPDHVECPGCGALIGPGSAYCPECGTRMKLRSGPARQRSAGRPRWALAAIIGGGALAVGLGIVLALVVTTTPRPAFANRSILDYRRGDGPHGA